MEQAVVCNLIDIRGAPIFAVAALGQKWKRVFGATYLRNAGTWLFPAFFPYHADVVRDLKIVEPDIQFSSDAEKHITRCDALEALPLNTPAMTNGYQPVLPMFEHQKEGFEFVQRMFRCALFFDMGLGKTKIVYDVIRKNGLKTLVLVPSVGLGTWVQEAEIHAPELTIARLVLETEAGRTAFNKATRERNALKKQIDKEVEVLRFLVEQRVQNEENQEVKARFVALLAEMKKSNRKLKPEDLVAEFLLVLVPEDVTRLTELVHELNDMVGPTRAAKLAEIEAAASADVLITTYDTAKLYQPYIFDHFDYRMIVADESQNLRSPKTTRTKAALALATKACRRVILTGTPSLGNPMHLYGQLAFLGSYIPAKNQWIFRKHHIVFAPGSNKIQVGYKNLDMLNAKVQRVAIVRTKDECLDLPDRTIVDSVFDVSSEQRKLYNGLVDRAVVELGDGTLYDPDHAATVLQKLLQILSGFMILPPPPVCDNCKHVKACVDVGTKPFTPKCPLHPNPWPRKIQRMKANPKLEALLDLLDGIPDEKVIIWAYFIEELNIVQEALEERGIKLIRIDGSNSQTAAAQAKRFNEDPSIKVWLAQVSTGVALTLTAAAYTIYFGLTYRLDDYLQSMDRNYRIGQQRATFVYRLLCPRSALEFVARALSAKQNLADTLTDNIDCVLCDQGPKCLKKGTEPFGKGCKYQSRVNRVITKPGKL